MKAVIYARYSSDSQREESIEGQLRECTAFAEKNGITVLRHYIDRAYSAKTDNRPEFQSMIKDSGKRLFDIVIVWKLDRFARNRYDSARYKATLKKNGVKVVSATESISEGAEGIILESVLEGYAEYYSADLSEKVVRGMTDNALKCKFNGGMMPIGYVIDAEQHFRIDPLTAPFVLEAFKRYDGGETISSIMNWLNEQGLTNTRGRKMTFNSVGHILHNRRYIGEFRYRDVIVPDGIPAIVPQDLFDRVQEKLAKNKKAPARHKAEDDYLLTTKLSGFPAILCPAAKFVLSPLYWILLCPAEPLHAIKMLNHVIKALPHPSLPAPHTEALWRQASGTTSRCIHCLYRGALQRHSAMSADRVPGVLWKNAEASHL